MYVQAIIEDKLEIDVPFEKLFELANTESHSRGSCQASEEEGREQANENNRRQSSACRHRLVGRRLTQ